MIECILVGVGAFLAGVYISARILDDYRATQFIRALHIVYPDDPGKRAKVLRVLLDIRKGYVK